MRTSFLSISILSSFLRLSSGLILTKVIALAYGPDGMFFYGQMQSTINILLAIAQLGIGYGFIANQKNLLSASGFDYNKCFNQLLPIYSIGFTLLLASIFLPSSDFIANYLDLSLSYVLPLRYVICFGILSLVLFSTIQNILISCSRVGLSHLMSIAQYLTSIILCWFLFSSRINPPTFVLVLLPVISTIIILLFLFFIGYNNLLSILRKFKFKLLPFSTYKSFVKFSIFSVFCVLTAQGTTIASRLYILSQLSLEQSGIWQSLISIGSTINLVFISYMSSYFFSSLSYNYNSNRRRIIQASIIILFSFSLIFPLFHVFHKRIFDLLFSADFTLPSSLILIYIAAEFFRCLSMPFSFYYINSKNLKYLISSEIISLVVFIGSLSSLSRIIDQPLLVASISYFLSCLFSFFMLFYAFNFSERYLD